VFLMMVRCFPLALICVLLSFRVLCDEKQSPSWSGIVRTVAGEPIAGALVQLSSGTATFTDETSPRGEFRFVALPNGQYRLSILWKGSVAIYGEPLNLPAGTGPVQLEAASNGNLTVDAPAGAAASTGGEKLEQRAVSELPLNKRDFSQLLLLAAGTMTDSNGATNFTQQFAINGQRGTAAVFAMDGADISDPEMGGATFSNFNVDAVQEIKSSSGWMPAEIGRGAAGFTDILTRSGTDSLHGSAYEFLRNGAFDARNFFDRRSVANPGRIPPFHRNEFGFTNGGPVILPRVYNGRGRTYYFVEYQGFRQTLGTTQVIPVPTLDERAGRDTTAFPGETLLIPVDPRIAKILSRYPEPNDAQGPYGARTYATSSKVVTDSDQFSVRIDHKLSEKDQLFGRFSLDDITGPTTNPSQTVIDPSFAVRYIDRQRNAAIRYTRTVSPRFTVDSSISFTRTTPSFPTANYTDPALKFGDGLYESFNAAAGSVTTAIGNLFQARQNFTYVRGRHTIQAGAEWRGNRDTTYFGTSPNGEYTFGGGTAYSPVSVRSASGAHNIAAGDPLPDALSGLLTASAFAYTIAVAPPQFPQGSGIGVAAISRDALNFFLQDAWKVSDRLLLSYGLRYEVNSRIRERASRTSILAADSHGQQTYLINPQPPFGLDLNGWGPRLSAEWRAPGSLIVRAGAGITTLLPNLWQDNFLTGGTPFVVYPRLTAAPGVPIQFGANITPDQLPTAFTPAGQQIFAAGDTKAVPPNTEMDVNRFETDLAALTPDHQITPLNISSMSRDFRNGYIGTWTFGLEQRFSGVTLNAAYVGTTGVALPAVSFPNAYPGAEPQFARYTQFDNSGNVSGGFGTEMLMTNRSHSTYHALQLSAQNNLNRFGLGFQASYTWSKSIDDTSSVLGGFIAASSGAVAQAWPQDPFHTSSDRGPSTFDITHAVTLSLVQEFHAERASFLRPLGKSLTEGWQVLSISTITSGPPFTIYSGVQQTGVGSNGTDRPDQVGTPVLSTSRKIREDYFGLGDQNASFFSIPLNVSGGAGSNRGRFGALGRNTFRGPAFHNFDFALIKDTRFGQRGSGELATVQLRAEFFNLFNLTNFGLPANIVKGPGFGEISRTAGTSRQIQFSIKVIY
jgi:hypothetical protein